MTWPKFQKLFFFFSHFFQYSWKSGEGLHIMCNKKKISTKTAAKFPPHGTDRLFWAKFSDPSFGGGGETFKKVFSVGKFFPYKLSRSCLHNMPFTGVTGQTFWSKFLVKHKQFIYIRTRRRLVLSWSQRPLMRISAFLHTTRSVWLSLGREFVILNLFCFSFYRLFSYWCNLKTISSGHVDEWKGVMHVAREFGLRNQNSKVSCISLIPTFLFFYYEFSFVWFLGHTTCFVNWIKIPPPKNTF